MDPHSSLNRPSIAGMPLISVLGLLMPVALVGGLGLLVWLATLGFGPAVATLAGVIVVAGAIAVVLD